MPGGDPLADKEGERDAPTVADLAQLYLDTHAKSKRPVPAKTDRYTIEREILPAMKHLKVAEVKYSRRRQAAPQDQRACAIPGQPSPRPAQHHVRARHQGGYARRQPDKGCEAESGDTEGALPIRRRANPAA